MDKKLTLTPQIAAMYWGSQVCKKTDNRILTGYVSAISEEHIFIKDSTNGSNIACLISHCQLELKSLSEISDEDAIDVAKLSDLPDAEDDDTKMYLMWVGKEIVFNYFLNEVVDNGGWSNLSVTTHIRNVKSNVFFVRDIINFLRSKGYDCDNLIGTVAIKKEVSNG